ncbi:MAG: sugar phosphate isomerase/epimerase [Chloroflexi bacterium]|nr:sugar phosphate isomerase/epimerase [Chloroflexota bacterium]
MQITNIGIAAARPDAPPTLAGLEETLGRLRDMGYTLVELDPSGFATIVDGQVRHRQLADLAVVLRNSGLRFSIHGISRLNLAYDPRHDLCRRIMTCQIEICRVLGATRLVYHSGLQALDLARSGVRRTLLTDDELAAGARREVEAFKALAPLAEAAGVVIGMENGDSHQWEHTLIAAHGLPREALLKHHARLRIEPIIAQLEAIDHPAVGLTLDIAHLHIAAHDMGFDYLEAISAAAPWTRHLHVNDNFGRLDQGFDTERDRWAFGEADIHMPPGWGSIPYRDVFDRLSGYHGDLILEIKPGFWDAFGEALRTTRALLA